MSGRAVYLNSIAGYRGLRTEILRGLRNGRSFALVGGRKCGASTLLKALQNDIAAAEGTPQRFLPYYLDMRAVVPRSPFDFFRSIYALVTEGWEAPAWEAPRNKQHYQEFLELMNAAAPRLEEQHGGNWVAVLLIDSLDSAGHYLPDDEAFQNLRNLLGNSRLARHFRVIASGVAGLGDLIRSGSPLNNLDPKYLRLLTVDEARTLISATLPDLCGGPLESDAMQLSGRHPYLLSSLLRYASDLSPELDKEQLHSAARRLVRDRLGIFRHWMQDLREDGCNMYQALLASSGALSTDELYARMKGTQLLDESLLALSYHCLVDDADAQRLEAPHSVFAGWFRNNRQTASTAPLPKLPEEPTVDRKRRVFVVYGRDERLRVATFTFLRSLGLQPMEWHEAVEATGNPAPHIGEVLNRGFETAGAVVVLLTPDDEARLKQQHRKGDDATFEAEWTGQPRPNVLFEAGMALAKFPKATILVRVGSIRPFTDLGGIHMLAMDDSFDRRHEFVQRLKMAGCDVKDSGTTWQTAGEFE